MTDYQFLTYELLDKDGIARIFLDRPDVRNAQDRGLLVELNEAFLRAEADDQVSVVISGGCGPMFSAGHDMGSKTAVAERGEHPSYKVNGGTRSGAEYVMLHEWHHYFQCTLRWRNLRKITVAQVHGDVYAAGLMLMWTCDLIVAAEDTGFAGLVDTRLRRCGVEYFAHPWEFGPRKTKGLMLTGDSLSVDEATHWGRCRMSSLTDQLAERMLEFARRPAQPPAMTAPLIKELVNQTVDKMGFHNALNSCFTLHELKHSHWASIHENGMQIGLPEDGVPRWKDAPPILAAVKEAVRADG